MQIVIIAWALDSYLKMKHSRVFTDQEYKDEIRPDTLLLANYPNDPKLNNASFFSIATDLARNKIPGGYKMKWHQVGSGKIQLRLPVGIFSEAILCEAYVKGNDKEEKRREEKRREKWHVLKRIYN